MRRETVADFSVDFVRVLDAEGRADEEHLPDLSDETLLSLYRNMRRSRRFDEKAISLQRRGEVGTHAPAIGQEAAQVGSASALTDDDWMVTAFREVPAYLTRGTPMHKLLWYSMGMEEGAEIPEGERTLPPSIAVGSQPLHAAGLGWSQEIRGQEAASLVYFGDGATSEGDFYEALNMAGVFDSHAVFLCQNNRYAISVPREQQTHAETLAQKAIAAGIDGIQVDGNDVLGVYRATEEALSRARDGEPVMLEALTYRLSMHTTADDPRVYRTEEEEEEWELQDPILRFEKFLRDTGRLDDERVATIDDEIEAEIDDAVERAREGEAAADPEDMFEYAYGDPPAAVERQRAAFRGERDE